MVCLCSVLDLSLILGLLLHRPPQTQQGGCVFPGRNPAADQHPTHAHPHLHSCEEWKGPDRVGRSRRRRLRIRVFPGVSLSAGCCLPFVVCRSPQHSRIYRFFWLCSRPFCLSQDSELRSAQWPPASPCLLCFVPSLMLLSLQPAPATQPEVRGPEPTQAFASWSGQPADPVSDLMSTSASPPTSSSVLQSPGMWRPALMEAGVGPWSLRKPCRFDNPCCLPCHQTQPHGGGRRGRTEHSG